MAVPVILAIETSQRVGSVAVRDASGVVHVEALHEAKRHDDDLMPAIERLFARLGLQPRDLDAAGVSIGPGGFTGLRIAISTVKMFASALGVAVVAVPSALVAAAECEAGGRVMVALACKGSSWWATRLTRIEAAHWTIDGDPGLVDAVDFDASPFQAVVADRHFPDEGRAACAASGVPILEPTWRAESCLAEAARRLKAGCTTEASRLLPIYPRPPEAALLWARRREAGATDGPPARDVGDGGASGVQ